jgi:hypothetical protein
MQIDDGMSWQVVMDPGRSANFLLFVRDTYNLSPVGPDVPPRLTGGIDRLNQQLQDSDLVPLGEAWLAWWRRFIHLEGKIQLGDRIGTPQIEQDYFLAIVAAQRAAFDPPRFECLSNFLKLQETAQGAWPSFDAWYRASKPNRTVWNSSILASVAGEVIKERMVSSARVRAGVTFLRVEGVWTYMPEPGVLLCSGGLLEDDQIFATELKMAIESQLG